MQPSNLAASTESDNGTARWQLTPSWRLTPLLGKGVRVDDPEGALARLLAARDRLDEYRPRRSCGWRTAAEHDAALQSPTALVDRTTFYEATRCAIQDAVLNSTSERDRRRSTRAAILHCMEDFGLITMTRGEALGSCSNRAEFRE